MFATWCTLSAAIAYDLGWRVRRPTPNTLEHAPPLGTRAEALTDLAIFFASGKTLPDVEAFVDHMQRKVQEIDQAFRRFGSRVQDIAKRHGVE